MQPSGWGACRILDGARASAERCGLRRGAGADVVLFVNLHTFDLLDPELYAKDSPLTKIASRVILEVTERAALDDVKDVVARVASLRSLGFRVAIDDLGAGYAGLSSFVELQPEFVKLDMSLVRDVHKSSIRQRLIGSMTTLCKYLGMQVLAEGIETAEERDAVRGLGCDMLQGEFTSSRSRPLRSRRSSGTGGSRSSARLALRRRSPRETRCDPEPGALSA